MFLRIVLVWLLLVGLCEKGISQPFVYAYSERCHAAYQSFMSLNPADGRKELSAERSANPGNLMPWYISDYEDCLELIFNGDKAVYEAKRVNFEKRLDQLEKGDANSPWYRYCRAGVYMHWAIVQGRFGEHFKAALNFRKSFLLVKENEAKFPGFGPNKMLLGLHEAIVGTIPDDYKWIASVFGMKGNVRKGVAQITAYINNGDTDTPLRAEALIYYAYLKYYLLSEQEAAWAFVNSTLFETEDNLLNSFVKANLALNYRKAGVAVQTLKQMQEMPGYNNYPIFDFEMGSALLLSVDEDAVLYHNRFIQRYRGGLFIKDAWQQLAYSYYLQGNISKANYCRKQILLQGSKETDADKQAMRFASNTYWPAVPVLQARLLIDGGYYKQAYEKLKASEVNKLPTVADRLEYYFRLARVYDVTGQAEKALVLYDTTISMGRHRKEHFAARSALQTALLHEKNGRLKDAVEKFKECLSMKGHDFQANIDQQAKAGLNRLTHR